MDKLRIDADKCIGCGFCEAECSCNNGIKVHQETANYNISGTCISGFIFFFSKAVQKYLGIENEFSIYCAVTEGYPDKLFIRHLIRNDNSINWNLSSRIPSQKIT